MNDEDEFKENDDDDSRHAAAVLLTDNMDDEYELKEKRRNRREEYSYWRKDRESSVFSATNTRIIVWLMADPTALQRQIAPEREKWEICKKKHHRKNKTDDKAK